MLISHVNMRQRILTEFHDLLALGKLRVWELSTTVKTIQEICLNFETSKWCEDQISKNMTDVLVNEADFTPWSIDWNLGNEIWYSMNVLRAIPTQYYLIFQTDGLLCRPLTSEYVQELKKYDYVGAPWSLDKPFEGNGFGGNGGFTFRNRDLLLKILLHFQDITIGGIEDSFFSSQVHEFGGKLPPLEFAKSFAVETIPFDKPLAFHKPWKYLREEDIAILTKNCPAIIESRASTQIIDLFKSITITSCLSTGPALPS